jgi:hypothetical protein
MRRCALSVLWIGLVALCGCGQSVDDVPGLGRFIETSYSKREVRIPMRDGAQLHTAIYTPVDASHDTTYPILMTRTPYSSRPYGEGAFADRLGPSEEFAREGYIFVTQDVRGRFMSDGEFVNMRPIVVDRVPGETDETTDAWDTVEWLVRNVPFNNGRVGIWGNSYPGFYTAVGIVDSHPAIAAALPSAPIADWYFDDMHHHGAFALNLAFNFLASFGVAREGLTEKWPPRFDHGTPDGYRFFLDLGPLANVNRHHFHGEIAFWNDIASHPDYEEFWQSRSTLPHLSGISCAVLVLGGLFDAEDLYGIFHTYRAIENLNPGIDNRLVIGPWRHGGGLRTDGRRLGDADFGFETAVDFRERVLLPYFDHHLKGGPGPQMAEAEVFETGANRWRTFDEWPPPVETRSLFLAADGGLTWRAPGENVAAFDEYVSDPAKPVPYTATITTGWHAEYMTEDQRFASRRPDVLVYRTGELKADITVAGPLTVELWVATTGEDADWVVKLVDEHPGRLPGFDPGGDERDLGHTERLVRSEIFRGRYREGYDRPLPFVPGEVMRVEFPLQDVLHTFRRGHRIQVQVQSSLFPFFDRNPQTWVPNIFEADAEDFVAATHRVHRSAAHPSALHVGVLSGAALDAAGR